MANLLFDYMYRDGDNYKKGGAVVFKGCPADLDGFDKDIRACLQDDEHFVASQVGVPEVFLWQDSNYEYHDDSDHCYHEFVGVEATERKPTDKQGRTAEQFLDQLRGIGADGWEAFDPGLRLIQEGR